MRWTCLLFLVSVPALSWAADPADGGIPAAASAAPSGSAVAALDALWPARGEPAKAEEALTQGAAALAASPADAELQFRVARATLWVADGEENADRKQKLGREVWDLGEKLVKARPTWVGGHYYAAAGIGVYSQAVGILRALGEGLEGKFNERLDKAIELDSTFQHQMPLLAKGRYYFELPWPKRNLGKSASFYRRALAADPGNLAGARAQLARVQDGRLPDDPAEEARAKSIARKVASQMDKEGAR